MIAYSTQINLFKNLIATGLLKSVFHSVVMKPVEGGGTKPAAPINGRFIYVGPDDAKGFYSYARQNGSVDVKDIQPIGGCNTKLYKMEVPVRLVFFNMNEKRSHDDLISLLVKAVIKTEKVRLQKLVTNHDDILRSEAPTGRFKFTANTLYFAIEIFVLLDVQADTCQQEIKCEGVPNPFCL